MYSDSERIKRSTSTMASSDRNPFTMPMHLAQYRVLEEEHARQERRRQRTLKVHKKGVQPRESRRKIMARYMREIEEELQKEEMERMFADDVDLSLPETHKPLKLSSYHKGSLQDFIEKERQIARLKYFIAEGQKTIQSLEAQIAREEVEMAKAEERYTDEAFAKYVEDEVEKTTLAVTVAEEYQVKALSQKEEIQRIQLEIEKVRKGIAKYNQMLKLDKQYKEFLWKLSPPEWQKQQEVRTQIAENLKAAGVKKIYGSVCSLVLPPIRGSQSKGSVESYKQRRKNIPKEDDGIVEDLEEYEKPQMFFSDPKQLLNIMEEMEEKTQRLFKELDSIERSLEFYRECARKEQAEMEKENTQLAQEIGSVTKSISGYTKQAEKLKQNVELLKSSEGSLQKKNADLKRLKEKIEQVYKVCLEQDTDTPDSCEMLKAIELYLYELLEKFESLPTLQLTQLKRQYKRDKIASARKQEKLQKVLAQEEKRQHRAALRQQRAMVEFQKPMGKKEMFRSVLVKSARTAEERRDARALEQQELEKYLLE